MADEEFIEFKIIDGRKYSNEHLWYELIEEDEETGSQYKIGISDYLQADLGEISRVILAQAPDLEEFSMLEEESEDQKGTGAKEAGATGFELHRGDTLATIWTTDERWVIETQFTCNVIELNGEVEDVPEIVNDHPYQDGWLVTIRPHNFDPESLLEPEEYLEYLEEL